jgi:hypothetical protein
MRSANFLLTGLSVLLLAACASGADDTGSGEASGLTEGSQHRHVFVLQAKGFLAPISQDTIGQIGDPLQNVELHFLADVTNAAFSENPKDGESGSGQYRLWAQLNVNVTCDGANIAQVALTDPRTDAGYDGPYKGDYGPLVTRSTSGGEFYFQAHAAPAAPAEPVYSVVKQREAEAIWCEVRGSVSCGPNGDASLHIADFTTTSVPSFRLWSGKTSDGKVAFHDKLELDRPQGKFSELWSLAQPPAPPDW